MEPSFDVTSLYNRRAVNRWERTSVGDLTERVTWSYNLFVGGVKLSSSLTVVELTTVDGGTRLTFTETGAFYDGHEKPELREQGTGWLLDALGKSLD